MSDHATKSDLKEFRDRLREEMATKGDLAELRRGLTDDMEAQRVRFNDDMKTHMGTLYEKFSADVSLVSEQITGIDKRLGRVEKKVEVLTDTVGEIKVELTAVNDKLDRKADKSQVTLLDRRVAALEAK